MIDEKGRLFGKINLLDLLVLLVAVAALVVLVVQLVGSSADDPAAVATPTPTPTPTPVGETSLIEYQVQCNYMDPVEFAEIKKHFENGDSKLVNADGSEIKGTEILELSSKPYVISVTDDDGTIHLEEDPYYVNAVFTLRSVTNNAESHNFFGQEVRIGRSILIKTQFFEIYGLVVDCETIEVYPPEAGE